MTVNEVISSGLLESYVLGTTTAEETALVQDLCSKHPELLREIEQIEESLLNFSSRLSTPLRNEVKDRIFAKLGEPTAPAQQEAPAKVIGMQRRPGLYKLGIAASLLLFIISVFYNIMLHRQLNRLSGELASLTASKSYMADALKVQEASLKDMSGELEIIADPRVKKIALKGLNTLASRWAAVLMNAETNEVYFNAHALPAPDHKQYQLWAIVNGKPVDAGMIELSGNMMFQKMKAVPNAQAFAVTIEKPGGSPTPSLETMCLLGNV